LDSPLIGTQIFFPNDFYNTTIACGFAGPSEQKIETPGTPSFPVSQAIPGVGNSAFGAFYVSCYKVSKPYAMHPDSANGAATDDLIH